MPALTRTERTVAILNHFKGLPGEFYMLKALLLIGTAASDAARAKGCGPVLIRAERGQFDEVINQYMIAERMDELRTRLPKEVL